MLMFVSAIYDSGTETWMPPLFTRNKGELLRWFNDVVNNPETKFARHPADYALFELGTWDDDKCEFDLHKAPIRLSLALELQDPEVAKALKEAVIATIQQKSRGAGGGNSPA